MEYPDNEQHPHKDVGPTSDQAGNVQPPASLLPAVLSRLGLGQVASGEGKQINELQEALHSPDWQVRAAAVRALEKLGAWAPTESLIQALHDKDGSVRAAAVHALGSLGEHIPILYIVNALQDSDWHVRETAVLMLGKREQRIPDRLLRALANDQDAAVREATQLAQQWTRLDGLRAIKPEGKKQAGMQVIPGIGSSNQAQQAQQQLPAADNQGAQPFQTTRESLWDKTFKNNRNMLTSSNTINPVGEHMQEQEQKQEYEYDGYHDETFTRWEKVTSYAPAPRPHRLRGITIVSSIILFFILVAGGSMAAFLFTRYQTVVGPQSLPSNAIATAVPSKLPQLPGQQITAYFNHHDIVNAVQWSPDSTQIASASDDQTVQVWDAFTGQTIAIYGGHSAQVKTVAWSPDGNLIASGSVDGTIEIWQVSTRNLLQTLHLQAAATPFHIGALQALSGGGNPGVYKLAWSPDGKRLAAAMNSNIVQVFDVRTGGVVLTYSGFSNKVNALDWSPDGKYIVTTGTSNPTTVWNASTGQNIVTYPLNDRDAEYSLAWSPDSKRIALGNVDGSVRIWKPFSNEILAYNGHSQNVTSIAWSPDGKRIATASIDNTVQISDANTSQLYYTYANFKNEVRTVAWSPDGRFIAAGSADNSVQVWQA